MVCKGLLCVKKSDRARTCRSGERAMSEITDKALKLIEANFTRCYIKTLGWCFECNKCHAIFISPKDALRHLRYHKRVRMVMY